MNALSIFIYSVELLSQLNFLLGALIIAAIVHYTLRVINVAMAMNGGTYPSPKKYLMAIIPLGIMCVIIPNKETLYVVGASELGEEIIKNQEVQDLTNDLKEILQNKIEEMKGK